MPAEWEGKRAVGVFDFGMTGGGNNSGFESLLFVNGEQYQAVDANHKEVFFRPEICGNEVSLTFRLCVTVWKAADCPERWSIA